jgi:hypothetical protein
LPDTILDRTNLCVGIYDILDLAAALADCVVMMSAWVLVAELAFLEVDTSENARYNQLL